MDSRGPGNEQAKAPTAPSSSRWQRYWKTAIGVLAAFGILGSVGGYLVNAVGPDLEEKVGGGGPLGISVREDPQGGSDGFRVAARSATGLTGQLAGAKDCDSLFQQAKRAGAVDVGQSIHSVVLEGRTHRDVAIVDMRAVVLKREPMLTGAEIKCQSAGAIEAIGVGFNLDEHKPTARTIRDLLLTDPLGGPYFAGGNIVSLKKTEVQPFQIVGLVSRDYVEWEISARVLIDGQEEEITIDNNGEPFRITGGSQTAANVPSVDYSRYYEWVWYETPQRLYISDEPKV
jgi:hypothetical protein